MDAKTAEALEASIEHWREMTQVTKIYDIKIGRRECALCELFNTETILPSYRCLPCPVYRKTGQEYCEGTPFERASDISMGIRLYYHLPGLRLMALLKFRMAAREELAFLEGLRDD